MTDPVDALPTPVQPVTMPRPASEDPGFGLGIAALVSSFFVQIVGLVLGILALQQSKRAGFENPAAIAAIIVSAAGMVIAAVIIVATIVFAVVIVGFVAVLVGMEPGFRP
jgi:hypothetical protein